MYSSFVRSGQSRLLTGPGNAGADQGAREDVRRKDGIHDQEQGRWFCLLVMESLADASSVRYGVSKDYIEDEPDAGRRSEPGPY
jgi:hypothetical protein